MRGYLVPVLAVALLITATTGVTVAATADKGYVACANSHNVLTLEVKGKCQSGATEVRLGATGPRGPAGPAKLPHLYEAYTDGVDIVDGTVVSMDLPAGSYDVSYVVSAYSGDSAPQDLDCTGKASTAGIVMNDNSVYVGPDVGSLTDLTDDNQVTLASPQTLSLNCTAGDVSIRFAHLVALPVGKVTETAS